MPKIELSFIAGVYREESAGHDRLVLAFGSPNGHAEATLTLDEEDRLLRAVLDRRARARRRERVVSASDLTRQDEIDAAIVARRNP